MKTRLSTDEEIATLNAAFDVEGEDISQEKMEYELDEVLKSFEKEELEAEALLAQWRGEGEFTGSLEPLRRYILARLPLFKRTEIIELLGEVNPDFYDGVVNIRPVEKL